MKNLLMFVIICGSIYGISLGIEYLSEYATMNYDFLDDVFDSSDELLW